jgi:hypothetical protein
MSGGNYNREAFESVHYGYSWNDSDDGIWFMGLFAFRTLSIIFLITEHNVSETGSVPVFRRDEMKKTYSVGPVRKSYSQSLDKPPSVENSL